LKPQISVLVKKLYGKLFMPLAWTIFIEGMFCLPGNDLPGEGMFSIPNFDKLVHVIFFGTFVGLWCLYFRQKVVNDKRLSRIFFAVLLIAVANGIAIEYIQFYFIPLRSFDEGDIIADVISAAIAYGVCNVRLLSFSGN